MTAPDRLGSSTKCRDRPGVCKNAAPGRGAEAAVATFGEGAGMRSAGR